MGEYNTTYQQKVDVFVVSTKKTTRKSSKRSTRKPTLEEQFKDWAGQLDIETEIVHDRYNVILAEKIKTFSDIPEKVLVPSVTRLLRTDLRRDFGSLLSKAPTVRGFFTGASELVDFIDLMRKKAHSKSNESEDAFEEAKVAGLINADGEPLDTRATIFGRQPNPTFGLPLDELPEEQAHSYRRVLEGVGFRKGSDFPQFFTIEFQREMALDLEFSLLTPVTWRANIIKEGMIVRQRATEAATRIRPIKITYNYRELIEEACEILQLSAIDNWHLQNVEDWDRLLCAKGIAAAISDKPHPTTDSIMIIMDDDSLGMEDMGHRLYVPDYLPINFGEDTEVIFWGMTNVQALRSTEEEIIVTNVHGLYPIGDMITPEGYKSGKRVTIEWDDAVE